MENVTTDILQGCAVVTFTLLAFIGLVWLRDQILHGGGPEWLEQEVKLQSSLSTSNDFAIPLWIEAVSNYLQFDHERSKFLSSQHSRTLTYHPVEQSHGSSSQLQIDLPQLSLIWGWKWKESRDVLRLSSASSGKLRQQSDLDALVQVCNSQCDKALELILKGQSEIQAETTMAASEEEVADDDDEDVVALNDSD